MHFIYAIGAGEPPYKIGRSSDVTARVRELQTGNARPISAIITAETLTPIEHERAVHSALKTYRLAGEWFACDIGCIIDAFRSSDLSPDYHVSAQEPAWMTGLDFTRWTLEMTRPPFFASDAECARLLGVSANGVLLMKKNGADRRTALACRALLHRMEPYGA